MADDEKAISRASDMRPATPAEPYTMTPAEYAHSMKLAETIEQRARFEGETFRLWTQLRALLGHYRH